MLRLLLLLPLFGVLKVFALTKDTSLIDFSYLSFYSDFERKQFLDIRDNQKVNGLNLLLCLDSSVTDEKAKKVTHKLNAFLEQNLSSKVNAKSESKTVKAFFESIHNGLLKKYTLESRFEKMLDAGEYNCVTASALYALAFERYGIPFQIRSTDTHVYILASPGDKQILIESTDPTRGFLQYSDAYKKTFVDMMAKQKMISKDEVFSTSTEQLFNKYFYKSDTTDMKGLVSYHYYNYGISLIEAEKFKEAISQFAKAYYLNPDAKITYMLYLSLAYSIETKFELTDTSDINNFVLYNRLNPEKNNYDFIYSKWALAADDVLIRKDDLATFEYVSNRLLKSIDDTSQLMRFREFYHSVMFAYYIQKSQAIKGLSHLFVSYCINDKNIRTKDQIDKVEKYLNAGDFKTLEDFVSFQDELKRLDSTCINDYTKAWSINVACLKASYFFENNTHVSGLSEMKNVEKMIDTSQIQSVNKRYIAMMYRYAYMHYYKNYEITKARSYASKGLSYAPDNEELLSIMRYSQNLKDGVPVRYNNSIPPPQRTNITPRTVIIKPGSTNSTK